jgi:hypothetical protein
MSLPAGMHAQTPAMRPEHSNVPFLLPRFFQGPECDHPGLVDSRPGPRQWFFGATNFTGQVHGRTPATSSDSCVSGNSMP